MLGSDGHGIRAINVIATSRMIPSEELTMTAGSVSPKASFKRALLPVCTVTNVPASSATETKSHERFILSP
jgi:hypothetical protein